MLKKGIEIRRGKERKGDLLKFADLLNNIQKRVGFKLSSRGWCYQLEGFNIINKGQFNKIQNWINECRKKGYLPIDFTAADSARLFQGVSYPERASPAKKLKVNIAADMELWKYHTPDYWEGEEYYIQMMVEKVDLVTLFKPVCKKYRVPISNARGWSDIAQRADMCCRFKKAEKKGQKCVLLYYGDHDPYGLLISDYLKKNLADLSEGTGYDPKDLIIDRFGLNHDFIESQNLTWIDNLTSGSGKQPDYSNPVIAAYCAQFGERKVEANAVVIVPDLARQQCVDAIEKYMGKEALIRYNKKRREIKKQYEKLMEDTGIAEPLKEALDLLQAYIDYENGDD